MDILTLQQSRDKRLWKVFQKVFHGWLRSTCYDVSIGEGSLCHRPLQSAPESDYNYKL